MYCSNCPSPRACGSSCSHAANGTRKKVLPVRQSKGVSRVRSIPMPFKKSMPNIVTFSAQKVRSK